MARFIAENIRGPQRNYQDMYSLCTQGTRSCVTRKYVGTESAPKGKTYNSNDSCPARAYHQNTVGI